MAPPATATTWPQPAAPTPKRGLGVGAIIGIAGGGVALLLVIVLIVALVVPLATRSSSPGPAAVVEDYLAAIADGDAETAAGFVDRLPADRALLTDEVLAVSAGLAPITDIEMTESNVSSGIATVVASYSLGDSPVTVEYQLYDLTGDGGWSLSIGLTEISLLPLEGMDVTVNGVAVDGDSVSVFPGTYEFATPLDRFTLAGETVLTVTGESGWEEPEGMEPALTEAATEEFRAVVRAAVAACIASTALAAGCGLDLPATLSDGTTMTDGTIRRSLPANTISTLDSLEPTLSYTNPTLAQGEFLGSVQVSGDCTKGGASGTCDVLFAPSLGRPSVDMASDELTVLWD